MNDDPATGTQRGAAAPLKIDDLLRFMVKQEASDLHLKPMRPPLLRVNNKLVPLRTDPLPPDAIREMLEVILSEKHRRILENDLAVDFGYGIPGFSRFRATLFYQRGTVSAVFRRVPIDFPALDEWGLPPVLGELTNLPQGLVLITGPAGSGKSSTLAALMRLISNTQPVHIITVEDPIEFLLKDNLGCVTQREVGTDTPDFVQALRNALRQDPDVIMVGEMRDVETIGTVLTAAETGHLVFSTLHTNSAAQTIDRIIDSFPAGNHRQIRQQLSSVLQAVVTMKLVERADGKGLAAAVEILRSTPRVSKLIFDGNLEALQEEIENSVSYHKMQSLNQSLAALVLNRAITRETALRNSSNPADLDLMLRKFLYLTTGTDVEEESPMAESLNDYSRIVELQEIKKLYDDLQERSRMEISERDQELARLRAEVAGHSRGVADQSGAQDQVKAENERLTRQLQLLRDEYENRIERLNARIKELSAAAPAAAAEAPGKGFFRR